MGSNPFLPSDKPEFFACRRFHCDIIRTHLQDVGKLVFHGRDEASQFRPLHNNGRIHVSHIPAGIGHLLNDLFQQFQAVRTLPLRIGIGEKSSDISELCRPEKRVDNRVGEDVRIGITVEP